jgi:UDP-N-acetylmuramate--alanine ligase
MIEVTALQHKIHLVGIGGIGMSAIARVLAAWGHEVSGSDVHDSPICRELTALGIRVYIGHSMDQVNGAELVVMSSAIPETNPELAAARQAGIPVIKRQSLVTRMMAGRYGIAVAGTHGKTTTAALIAVLLERLGLSPTFIVGGVISDLHTNARAGSGPHFVIEADEYDRMFHGLSPRLAVVTNVEMDHPDCYRDIAEVREAFSTFLERVSPDGLIVACADSPHLMQLIHERPVGGAAVLTYGLDEASAYRVGHILPNARGGVDFSVYQQDDCWGRFGLSIPGTHNALNATAALIVGARLGLPLADMATVLRDFHGALRRFEVKGERRGIVVIDDYAHHPTKIRATLAAARLRYGARRLWAVWQPHTYSRVETLLDEFGRCFDDADHVIVMDTFAARAREKATLQPAALLAAIRHPAAIYRPGVQEVVDTLREALRPGDVLLVMGAGDSYLVCDKLLAELGE